MHATYSDLSFVVRHEPLKALLLTNSREELVLNDRGFLHMENFRRQRTQNQHCLRAMRNSGSTRRGESDPWLPACHINLVAGQDNGSSAAYAPFLLLNISHTEDTRMEVLLGHRLLSTKQSSS